MAVGTVMLVACGKSNSPPAERELVRPSLPHSIAGPAPVEDPDVQRSTAEVEAGFEQARLELEHSASLDLIAQLALVGKLAFYDVALSVDRNQACATCHLPSAGFSGGVSSYNQTSVAYPGSVQRFGGRRPPTAAYATMAPQFHWDGNQQDFYGGNFWDMRATGDHLGNAAADQAIGPPVNALEMGISDPACVVYRISKSSYRRLFELVWGETSFAIRWPDDTDRVCEKPAVPGGAPSPLRLVELDRSVATTTYNHLGVAIANYEFSSEVSAFSSKLDAVLAGHATLTAQEQRGWDLFHGKANCAQCHLDGSAPGTAPADVQRPLFTDFSSLNLGIPANPDMPLYNAAQPDLGVGEFLRGVVEWAPLAPKYTGKFRVPTVRNADKRPRADFVKAYMHNGYLKSLKEVVHFYNTSQTLPRCAHGSPGEKVQCWPAPEVADNVNSNLLGNLLLTDAEEDDVVAFLQTLTDGFTH